MCVCVRAGGGGARRQCDGDGATTSGTPGATARSRRRRGTGRRRWAAGAAAMPREVVGEEVVVDETEFFVSAIYIGGAFSTGWSHQPVLKANFRQAKGRETDRY